MSNDECGGGREQGGPEAGAGEWGGERGGRVGSSAPEDDEARGAEHDAAPGRGGVVAREAVGVDEEDDGGRAPQGPAREEPAEDATEPMDATEQVFHVAKDATDGRCAAGTGEWKQRGCAAGNCYLLSGFRQKLLLSRRGAKC